MPRWLNPKPLVAWVQLVFQPVLALCVVKFAM
jgi:hypothetical protein